MTMSYISRHISQCIRSTTASCEIFVQRAFSAPSKAVRVTSDFVGTLKSIVGDANVSTADAVREQHSHDVSFYDFDPPDVVVFPESVDQVSHVSKFCNDNLVPLIPFGAGTGVEGGIVALRGGVCMDVSKMDQILAVNPQDFDCTVEAGVLRHKLNSYIRDTGLFFPVDPGADASIGGMCGTSASGLSAVRYGTMRENVLNLQVVLPDGRVIDTAGKGRRTKKTSAGYNLTNLFVGSEGTLGIITKATLRLYGIAEKTISAVCHFNTVQDAVNTSVNILQCGIPMAKLELMDDNAIDAFNKYSNHNMPVAQTLFLEFHGPATGLEYQFNAVSTFAEELVEMNSGFGLEVASDTDERNRLWKARHEMVWACTALIPGSRIYSTDVCVPISKLPEIIVKTKAMIKEAGVVAPILGHLGDGNFHVAMLMTSDDEYNRANLNIATGLAQLALDMDGTCTGEHGIGMGKRDLLIQEIGEEGMEAMRQVKKTFDPNGIMNPDKVLTL